MTNPPETPEQCAKNAQYSEPADEFAVDFLMEEISFKIDLYKLIDAYVTKAQLALLDRLKSQAQDFSVAGDASLSVPVEAIEEIIAVLEQYQL